MSPFFNVGSFKKSPLVNRVRSVYRDNTTDSALDSLRMQSVNISHIRDLSSGLKSSSSDSSEDELDSYQRIDFSHRKRFHERRLRKSSSTSADSTNLERNNTFSEYEKRKNYGQGPARMSSDSMESPMDSDYDYKTPNMSQDEFSPLQFLLNYKSTSRNTDSSRERASTLDSFESVVSGGVSQLSDKGTVKTEVKSEPIGSTTVTQIQRSEEDSDGLSYSFNRTSYVFRICFEPKLSAVKDTTFIPSRVIINKSPFVIGSDASCDLVLSKKKFKFIAPKHCKISYQSCSSSNNTSPQNKTNVLKPDRFDAVKHQGDDIASYRVKIAKSSPSGTTYVNNSLLRGNLFLENGDLVSLGPRNNYLTFRVVFSTKKECQLLRSQLSITPQREDSISYQTDEDEYYERGATTVESEDDVGQGVRAERLVVADNINIMGVKIFVFQVLNYDQELNETQNVVSDKEEGNKDRTHESEQHSEVEHDHSQGNDQDELDYYKLRSPIRTYNFESAAGGRSKRDVPVNLQKVNTDGLAEVYSSSSRYSSTPNISQDYTDSFSRKWASQESEDQTQVEYTDKVMLLKSLIPDKFPITVDSNRSSMSELPPEYGGKTHYKLIGIVDASNDMNISELLPNVDEMVREKVGEDLENFQVVLKKFNTPVDRETLENSWVFQLEFLDTDNPRMRRAIFRHELFSEGESELERVLRDNKCRVMYIKTD